MATRVLGFSPVCAVHAQGVAIRVVVHGDGDVEALLQEGLHRNDRPGGDVLGVIDDSLFHVDDRGNADADLFHGGDEEFLNLGGQVLQGLLQRRARGEGRNGESVRYAVVFDQAEAQVGAADVDAECHDSCIV